ncbi:MAG: hypothetical protein AB1516_15230 [Pseudomonadota bacterium]
MANENVSVSGPVEIKTDSKARVALDLMKHIDQYSELKTEQKTKDYWLKLFRQCYKAANGQSLESILKEE